MCREIAQRSLSPFSRKRHRTLFADGKSEADPSDVDADAAAAAAAAAVVAAEISSRVVYACDPCIDRPNRRIRAIVHGTSGDGFWTLARAAALQAAQDAGGIDLNFDLYDSFDADRMAEDVTKVAIAAERAATAAAALASTRSGLRPSRDAAWPGVPEALIVTIPSDSVRIAVERVAEAGVPVLGFNSGHEHAVGSRGMIARGKLLGFWAMDEYRGGEAAARKFWEIRASEGGTSEDTVAIERVLFVNGERGNSALDERKRGFNDTLHELVGLSRSSGELPPGYSGLRFDELVVDLLDKEAAFDILQDAMKGCRYQAVLLSSGVLVDPALAASGLHGCNVSQKSLIGTFDTSSLIFDRLILGHLALVITQQQHLQVVLPVLYAAFFVTTGKLPSPSNSDMGGAYLTGPRVFTTKDAPSDTLRSCQNESYPVCPRSDFRPSSSEIENSCPCTDRGKIHLGGVVHGVTTDEFWDPVFASAERAASDMGVELDFRRFHPQADEKTLHLKMSYKILNLCQSGVDGIFVSIPSEIVKGAVQACLDLDVPVISINAGSLESERLGLTHHVGMIEYNAGRAAGARLLQEDIRVAYCINHAPEVSVTIDRCAGFEAAIADASPNVRYGGMISVPHDNDTLYRERVEEAVGDPEGDWDGLGFLLGGVVSQLNAALKIKESHPKLKMGAIDVSNDLYTALDDGLILFGMDQQAFLQGYVPVSLLTYMAYTQEKLLNNLIETGPRLVTSAPSMARQICEGNMFEVCPEIAAEDYLLVDSGYAVLGIALFAVQAFFSAAFIILTYMNRTKMVVRVSQPEFLILTAFGCFVMGSAILPLLVQGEYRYMQDPITGQLTDVPNKDIRRVDTACMAFPWLSGIGFALVFSALFAKIFRVKKICQGAVRFSREKVKAKDAAIIVVIMTVAEVIILLSWQIISPLRWERVVLEVDENGYPRKSVGMCTSENYLYFLIPFIVFKILCLLYGLHLCYLTRNVPSALSEGKWISFSVIAMFQILLLAIPVLVIVEGNSDVYFFVRVAVVFLISFSVTAFIFFPKAFDLASAASGYGDSLRFSRGQVSLNIRTTQAHISSGNLFTDTTCASCTKSHPTQDMKLVCNNCKRNASIVISNRSLERNLGKETEIPDQTSIMFCSVAAEERARHVDDNPTLHGEEAPQREDSESCKPECSEAVVDNENNKLSPDCSCHLFDKNDDSNRMEQGVEQVFVSCDCRSDAEADTKNVSTSRRRANKTVCFAEGAL